MVSRDVKILNNRFEHVALLNSGATDAEEALTIIFNDPDGDQEVETVEPPIIVQPINDGNGNGGEPPVEAPLSNDIADQYEPSLSPIKEDDQESKYDSIADDSSTIITTTSNNIESLDNGGAIQTRTGRTIKPVTRYGTIDVGHLDPLSQRQFNRVTGGAHAHYVSAVDSIELVADNDTVAYTSNGGCNGGSGGSTINTFLWYTF